MGQHNSNFELASEARRAAERFDECEIKVIKETFKDLCHLNGGSMRIDKETFLQYLPLPGLLGERLFAVFDKKCSGEIDYEEFVCGLAVTCRGSWDEKVEFIFNIYDMHGQGAVNRDELAALLNHVPKSIMRFGRAVTLGDSASEHGGNQHHHHHHHPRDHRRATAPTLANQPPHHPPHHPGGHPPRHPPPSSAGTLSGGRCSPDRFLAPMPPTAAPAAAAAGGSIAGADAAAAAAAATAAAASGAASSAAPSTGGANGAPGGSGPGPGALGDGGSSPPLTSGNLMQLHASLSSRAIGSDGGSSSSPGPVLAGEDAGGEGVAVREASGGDGGVTSPPPLSVASGPAFPAVGSPAGAGEGDSAGGGGGAATAATHAGGHAAQGVPREVGGGGAPAASPHGGSGGQAEGDADLASGEASGVQQGEGAVTAAVSGEGEREGEEGTDAAAVRGPALGHAGELRAGMGAGSRRGTVRSDSSTDGGVSCAATQHHPHWEDFTNNDIVDQAFEECDLNHNGKLSFGEFRLWVERNPIVTQFLQSVFPYDEHREWGDDRKHLPFIHNREFTASPMRSEPSLEPDEKCDDETRRLLIKARNTTRDEALRDGIDRLIEQQMAGRGLGAEGGPVAGSVLSMNGAASPRDSLHGGDGLRIHSSLRSRTGTIPSGLLSELSPRSAKVMQHQTVAKQGFLWKQGYRLKTWKQRWYVLVGNCIYYYHHEADVYPSKVMFLTGSFVEPLQEVANERKGYWGIEISRNREQNHRRKWYTRSKVEQLKWVKELRKASAVVPIEDDFEIGEELGKGRFSRVCMCVNKHTLERKAVKIIMKEDMKQDEKDLLRAEIAIMRLVNHPNIIRMEAVYESKKDIFIVMQLHSGGELFDRIVGRPRFTEDEAFTVMYPLVESVAYLHEMGIVHRDLKPENILCGDRIEDIKIADFGLSKMVMPDEIMKMPCGTLTYVAPEVLTLNGYGKEADIWSVGTIMYLLLRGRLPFDGETREEIIENTIHGAIAWQNDHVWAAFSADAQDLVLGMLNKDQSRRYTAKEVLAHPWITQRELRREEHPEQFEFD